MLPMLNGVLLAAALAIPMAAMGAEPLTPGRTWTVRAPKDAGLDPLALERFSNTVGGRGCIVRGGAMVFTWGDPTRRGDVASAAKPVYTHFLLKACEDGKVQSVEDPVLPLQPQLGELNPDLGHKDTAITWRHLASQTSCYGVAEAPGAAFCYNDWQMALFWDLLFLKVYGTTPERVDVEVLRPLLTDLLQCEDAPTLLAFGTKDRAGRLAISPRDFARFGLLYLRRGAWSGQQLLSPAHAVMLVTEPLPNAVPRSAGHAAQMLPGQRSMGSQRIPDNQTDHMGSYSWLWWTNGVDREGKRHWPAAPADVFGCFGHGGRRAMAVFPGLDLIVSWNDTSIEGPEAENHAFELLLSALTTATEAPR